jgi:hypothetical protein
MPRNPRIRLNSMGAALTDASPLSRPATMSDASIRSTASRKSSMLSWQDDDIHLRRGVSLESEQDVIKEEPSDEGEEEFEQQRARVSLSEPGWQAWLCCQFPGACLFGLLGFLCITAAFSQWAFLTISVVLTLYVYLWATNLAIFSAIGAWRMRRECAQNWHALLVRAQEDCPGPSQVLHIVIIPNYKEDEDMLLETLENIGQSPSSVESIRVVLGMEAREGPAGAEKAKRLIEKTGHLFADIFATYHPPGLPGELAGKSSNTQWAYRQAL